MPGGHASHYRSPRYILSFAPLSLSVSLSSSKAAGLRSLSSTLPSALSALFSPVFPRCPLLLIAFLPHAGHPVSPRLIPGLSLFFPFIANATRRSAFARSLASRSRKITAWLVYRLLFVPVVCRDCLRAENLREHASTIPIPSLRLSPTRKILLKKKKKKNCNWQKGFRNERHRKFNLVRS